MTEPSAPVPTSRADRNVQARGHGGAWSSHDWLLALAFGSIAFLPATFGASILLSPVAWALASRDRRGCVRRGVKQSERALWALAISRAVTCVVGVIVGGTVVVGIVVQATRGR